MLRRPWRLAERAGQTHYDDGHWKGTVDTKLDDIKTSVSGTDTELAKINAALSEHGEHLTAVESSAKQAHHRIDEIVNDKKQAG